MINDTPLSIQQIKLIRSLSLKKNRDNLGLFVVEGEKMVEEALKSNFTIKAVYREEEIGKVYMARISQLSTPSPVLALIEKPETIYLSTSDELKERGKDKGDHGFFLGLDSISDPGNMGTIIRLADWFGLDAVFVGQESVDIFNPKVIQATMGSIFRVKIYYVNLPELCASLKKELNTRIYGTFLNGENIYSKDLKSGTEDDSESGYVSKANSTLLIIGNEAKGISKEVETLCTDRLTIPAFSDNPPESLNAAIACGICVSEFKRRGQDSS